MKNILSFEFHAEQNCSRVQYLVGTGVLLFHSKYTYCCWKYDLNVWCHWQKGAFRENEVLMPTQSYFCVICDLLIFLRMKSTLNWVRNDIFS